VSRVRRLLTFRSDRRASVSIELALALPMLITLLGGGLEITNRSVDHREDQAANPADPAGPDRRQQGGRPAPGRTRQADQ
jgi:hypothetical protein